MTDAAPAFDDAFYADLPYDPEVLFFDELLEVDAEANRVRARMPTLPTYPFTRHQRNHPVRHPAHVAGAVMIHATGMLGFIHTYYVLGLRHADGWVGYGTHIHKAVFRKLVPLGSPMECSCVATKVRRGKERILVRYEFDFTHEGERCYEGEQTAMWMQTSE